MLDALRRLYDRVTTGAVLRDGRHALYLEGRDGIRYSDGERSAVVETEMLSGPVSRVIYAGILTHWLPPHEAEPIPAERRAEIVGLVRAFLTAHGRKVEVDWGSATPPPGPSSRRQP